MILAVVFVVSIVPCLTDPCSCCFIETRDGLVGYGATSSRGFDSRFFLFVVIVVDIFVSSTLVGWVLSLFVFLLWRWLPLGFVPWSWLP